MTAALAKQLPSVALTVGDCGAEIRRYWSQLIDEEDLQLQALCRFEIDRWLDRRLTVMSEAAEQK